MSKNGTIILGDKSSGKTVLAREIAKNRSKTWNIIEVDGSRWREKGNNWPLSEATIDTDVIIIDGLPDTDLLMKIYRIVDVTYIEKKGKELFRIQAYIIITMQDSKIIIPNEIAVKYEVIVKTGARNTHINL